ncbi:hypothetical protein J2X76_001699 [Neorhizobium sp. 2083]|uniref:hypothetical protein n=1 Tax=Neorhizobium sp. 2083 TaxID=2817762 RepID=UPI002855CDE8|nr:hypothetical protein [Neorhizobium sp. 2083]MDR6816526.1 hypothetical protein [Neorhizobium sp. 2083]
MNHRHNEKLQIAGTPENAGFAPFHRASATQFIAGNALFTLFCAILAQMARKEKDSSLMYFGGASEDLARSP